MALTIVVVIIVVFPVRLRSPIGAATADGAGL
jgi:hypothetical protein